MTPCVKPIIPVEEHWELCPKCSNMDGGCPFCGKGYVRTTAGYAALIAFENKERRGRSPSDAAEVHFIATEATRLLAELSRLRAVLTQQEAALSETLDVLVDHWHNASTPAANSLAGWMELSDAEYARFVEEGPAGYAAVIAARAALAGGSV